MIRQFTNRPALRRCERSPHQERGAFSGRGRHHRAHRRRRARRPHRPKPVKSIRVSGSRLSGYHAVAALTFHSRRCSPEASPSLCPINWQVNARREQKMRLRMRTPRATLPVTTAPPEAARALLRHRSPLSARYTPSTKSARRCRSARSTRCFLSRTHRSGRGAAMGMSW